MNRINRATIRGKPLDDDCKQYGRPDSGQFGKDDKRCFCTGIWNRMCDDYADKCYACDAWNRNALPLKARICSLYGEMQNP